MPEQFADAVAYLDANNRWALNIAPALATRRSSRAPGCG